MNQTKTPIVKKSLMSWALSGNFKLQTMLLVTIVVSVGVRVLPLEMQKRIVNHAIKLRDLELLFLYCGLYLAAVILSGVLKYGISYFQTVIGQQALKEMRIQLYRHMLMLPLGFFRRTQPGMVVQSFSTELATAGDFVGIAVGTPITSLLTLLAFGGYLFWLNPLLAIASFAIYPFVLIVLPMIQKRANAENKKRVDTSRELSSKIGEVVTGIHEVQGNGAFQIEGQKFESLADKLLHIRIIWNLYRQATKVVNNFFTNLGPFLIFMLGGYLAIQGRLDLGALVAFLSAQDKLYDAWNDMVDVYQSYQDAGVSYYRAMEYFDVQPEFELAPKDRQPYQLSGKIEVKDLAYTAEGGVQLLDNINFSVQPGQQAALVGFSGSGKSTLALCIGQLFKYTGGHIFLDDKEVADLSKKDIVSNMGLVSQSPFIFDGTVEENLLYGCMAEIDNSGPGPTRVLPNLDDMIEVVEQTGILPDVLRFGLNSTLDSKEHAPLIPKLIRIRKKLARHINSELMEHVELFDKEKFLYYATIAKNITFGTANKNAFKKNNLPQNTFFLKFLEETGIKTPLLHLGAAISAATIDIFGALPKDDMLFEQSLISPDAIKKHKALAENIRKGGMQSADDAGRQMLLELALRFIPGKHKMVPMPDQLRDRILNARSRFREQISASAPETYAFYRKTEYIDSHTILNNLFFGKLTTSDTKVQDKINEEIVQLLIEENLLESVIKMGLQFNVGSKGDRLSGGQRQKLAIARVFLKKPKILIMDEATSALDNRSQARVQHFLDTHWKGKSTLIAVVHRLDIIKGFDTIGVMKSGKLEEIGSYEALMARKGLFYELVTGLT